MDDDEGTAIHGTLLGVLTGATVWVLIFAAVFLKSTGTDRRTSERIESGVSGYA